MAIITSGKFISGGFNVNLAIRSDLDWMMVYNYTTASAAGGAGCQFYWQRGMDAGTGLVYSKTAAVNALELDNMTAGGFTLFDTSITTVGNPVATTSTTNAVRPVVATGSTAGLAVGDVIRLSGIVAAPTLCGIDFQIDTIVSNTSFRIAWPLANAPGAVGGAGFYRSVPIPSSIFEPKRLFVVDINSVGATSVITTSVGHNVDVGEEVRFYVPDSANGMVQIDNLQGTVLSIDIPNNTFVVDIDSSSFTPFVWPAAAASPYTPAQCFVFGSTASGNQTLLDDATRNISRIGIQLGAGAGFPAGIADDVIYYVAGKSDLTTFEDLS